MAIKNKKVRDIVNVCCIIFSSFLYSCGMNAFVHSGNLFPGGFSGISRLLSITIETFGGINISFSVFYFILNILITLLVWKRVGHKFILLSLLWFTCTSIFTAVLPYTVVTQDPLLIAVFGGLISGFSIGLALRCDASSGGTDFIAIYFAMRYNMPTWNYILAANAVILVIAGVLFGWNQALYSIIFQFVSTQVVQMIHQRYKLTQINVVTNDPDSVCDAVFKSCRHGVTKIPCEGGFTDKPHWLLMITINTYQLKEVVGNIKIADPKAFLTVSNVDRIIGNYYQKPLE